MPEITANIGFEKKIWNAACLLRGNLDASEYKHVVLVFLKCVSDQFDARCDELVTEGAGFEEDSDAYMEENVFFVPAEARWRVVAEAAHMPESGKVIDNVMLAIEKDNPSLKGILPKAFARPELEKRRLGDVVDHFTNIRMKEHGDTRDILGRTHEYCLSMFAGQEGKKDICIHDGKPQQPYDVTLQTFIRNFMHHPENKENQPYVAEELKMSIIEMIGIFKSLSINNQPNTTNSQSTMRMAYVNG